LARKSRRTRGPGRSGALGARGRAPLRHGACDRSPPHPAAAGGRHDDPSIRSTPVCELANRAPLGSTHRAARPARDSGAPRRGSAAAPDRAARATGRGAGCADRTATRAVRSAAGAEARGPRAVTRPL